MNERELGKRRSPVGEATLYDCFRLTVREECNCDFLYELEEYTLTDNFLEDFSADDKNSY